MADDMLRALAWWALAHELADDAWKEAVERGRRDGGDGSGEPLDRLAAAVADEATRLHEAVLAGESGGEEDPALEELRFELGELRGRLESMEASVDALLARLDREGTGSA